MSIATAIPTIFDASYCELKIRTHTVFMRKLRIFDYDKSLNLHMNNYFELLL